MLALQSVAKNQKSAQRTVSSKNKIWDWKCGGQLVGESIWRMDKSVKSTGTLRHVPKNCMIKVSATAITNTDKILAVTGLANFKTSRWVSAAR